MASIFKSKRITSDSKSSSASKSGKETDSKSQRNSGSTSSSKSGAASTGGGAAPHSKASNYPKAGRSQSVDVPVWADEDCPPIDTRFAASTVSDKALSISRSGRYKAKGRIRASLFSDESVDGTDAKQDADKRGTMRGSSSSSSYEDRPTVLHMTGRPGANHAKADVSPTNWSATPNSVDL